MIYYRVHEKCSQWSFTFWLIIFSSAVYVGESLPLHRIYRSCQLQPDKQHLKFRSDKKIFAMNKSWRKITTFAESAQARERGVVSLLCCKMLCYVTHRTQCELFCTKNRLRSSYNILLFWLLCCELGCSALVCSRADDDDNHAFRRNIHSRECMIKSGTGMRSWNYWSQEFCSVLLFMHFLRYYTTQEQQKLLVSGDRTEKYRISVLPAFSRRYNFLYLVECFSCLVSWLLQKEHRKKNKLETWKLKRSFSLSLEDVTFESTSSLEEKSPGLAQELRTEVNNMKREKKTDEKRDDDEERILVSWKKNTNGEKRKPSSGLFWQVIQTLMQILSNSTQKEQRRSWINKWRIIFYEKWIFCCWFYFFQPFAEMRVIKRNFVNSNVRCWHSLVLWWKVTCQFYLTSLNHSHVKNFQK